MLERSEPILKVICASLAIFLVFQAVRLAALRNPLGQLRLPDISLISTNQAVPTNTAPGNQTPPAANTAALTNILKSTNSTAPSAAQGANPPPRPAPPNSKTAAKNPNLPPAIQERIDRIIQSELLGPVPKPLPMALLGIGGQYAFLRSPSGQTGLVSEGETLGEIKLIRIGINRVLIEHEGQPKELTIFSGYGSETLLPKGKENLK